MVVEHEVSLSTGWSRMIQSEWSRRKSVFLINDNDMIMINRDHLREIKLQRKVGVQRRKRLDVSKLAQISQSVSSLILLSITRWVCCSPSGRGLSWHNASASHSVNNNVGKGSVEGAQLRVLALFLRAAPCLESLCQHKTRPPSSSSDTESRPGYSSTPPNTHINRHTTLKCPALTSSHSSSTASTQTQLYRRSKS